MLRHDTPKSNRTDWRLPSTLRAAASTPIGSEAVGIFVQPIVNGDHDVEHILDFGGSAQREEADPIFRQDGPRPLDHPWALAPRRGYQLLPRGRWVCHINLLETEKCWSHFALI